MLFPLFLDSRRSKPAKGAPLAWCFCGIFMLLGNSAQAKSPWLSSAATTAPAEVSAQASALGDIEKSTDGKPSIHLDRLTFPADVGGAAMFEKHLRKVLRREAYRADWGAGRDNRIEYRFAVTELKFTVDGHALRIRCSAEGRLPKGQTAKSELTFGGELAQRDVLTKQVLEIVARGVITRLAELERRRRGLR